MSTFLKLEKRIFAILLAAIMVLSLLPALTIPVQAEPMDGTTLQFSVTLKTDFVPGDPVIGEYVKGTAVPDVDAGALPDESKPAYINKNNPDQTVYGDYSSDSNYSRKTEVTDTSNEVQSGDFVFYKKTVVEEEKHQVPSGGFIYNQKTATSVDDEFVASDGYVYKKTTGSPAKGQATDAAGYLFNIKKGNPETDEVKDKDGYLYKKKTENPDANKDEVLINGYVYKKTYSASVSDPRINNGAPQTLNLTVDKTDETKGTVKHQNVDFDVIVPSALNTVEAGGTLTIDGEQNQKNVSISGTFTVSGGDAFYGNKEDTATITGLSIDDENANYSIAYSAVGNNASLVSVNAETGVVTSNAVVTSEKQVTLRAEISMNGTVYAAQEGTLTIKAPSITSLKLNDSNVVTAADNNNYTNLKGEQTIKYEFKGTGVSTNMLNIPEGATIKSYDNTTGELSVDYNLANNTEYTVSVEGFADFSASFTADHQAPVISFSVPDYFEKIVDENKRDIFIVPEKIVFEKTKTHVINDESEKTYSVPVKITITDPEGHFDAKAYWQAAHKEGATYDETEKCCTITYTQEIATTGTIELEIPTVQDYANNDFNSTEIAIDNLTSVPCTVSESSIVTKLNLDAQSPFAGIDPTITLTGEGKDLVFKKRSEEPDIKVDITGLNGEDSLQDGDGSGIKIVKYALEGPNVEDIFKEENVSSEKELPINEEGKSTVEYNIADNYRNESEQLAFAVIVYDNVGNIRTYSQAFRVDTKAPTIKPKDLPAPDATDTETGIKYYKNVVTYEFDVENMEKNCRIDIEYSYKTKDPTDESKSNTYQYKASIAPSDIPEGTTETEVTYSSETGEDETGLFTFLNTDRTEATVSFNIDEGEVESYSATITDERGNKNSVTGDNLKVIVDRTKPVVTLKMSNYKQIVNKNEYHDDAVIFNISVKDIYFNLATSNEGFKFVVEDNTLNKDQEIKAKWVKDDSQPYTYKAVLDDNKEGALTFDYDTTNPLEKYVIKSITATVKDWATNSPDGETSTAVYDNTNPNTWIVFGESGISFDKDYAIIVDKVDPLIEEIKTPEATCVNKYESSKTYYFNGNKKLTGIVKDINLDVNSSYVTYKKTKDGETVNPDPKQPLEEKSAGIYGFEIPVEDGELITGLTVVAEDYALRMSSTEDEDKTDLKRSDRTYIVDTTEPKVTIDVSGKNLNTAFVNGDDVYVTFKNPASAGSGKQASQTAEKVKLTVTVTDRNIVTREANEANPGFESDVFFVTNNRKNDTSAWTPSVNTVNTKQKAITVTYNKEIEVAADASGTIRFDLGIMDLAGNVPTDATAAAPLTDTEKGKLFNAGTKLEKTSTLGKNIVADRERPSSNNNEKMTPVITLTPNDKEAATLKDGKTLLYKKSMSYSLTVYDPEYTDEDGKKVFSGLQDVSWEVTSDVQGLISTNNNKNSYKNAGIQKKSYTVPVIINGNGETNNIKVTVTAVDFAGNKTTYVQKLAIDNLAPRVTLRARSAATVRNGKYFNKPRYIDVTVEDLNFESGETYTPVTVTDGTKSGWTHNGIKHTLTCTYGLRNGAAVDADNCNFKMFAKDRATNSGGIPYDSVKPLPFVIDQTAPVINVTFNNNNASNGKYYNADRTATVNIVEHNFRAADVRYTPTARLDGRAITAPGLSGFTGGDSHNATIPFTADGDYSFTVNYTDLAGNPARQYTVPEFTIDKTKPEAVIGNVENHKAYRGEIRPTVTLTDINFNPDDYEITWTATKFGSPSAKQQLKGAVANTNHGITYTFNDLERLPKNDGIYNLTATLTDMAGNSFTTQPVMYSVNRFGSVYETNNQETADLVKNPFTNKAPGLSIRETNPDVLKSYSVSISVNGTTKKLKEGTDYTINRSETDAAWKRYVYDIADSVFKDASGNPLQGSYVITLHSKDGADNKNSNRTNNEANKLDMEFVIDNEPASGYVSVVGLGENNNRIQAASTDYTVYWEDNFQASKVQIYLNGEVVKTLEGKELEEAGGSYTLTVDQQSFDQTIYAVITDSAGNERTLDEVTFFLNASWFAQFLHNTVALICTIAGILIVIGLVIFLIVRKKKKAGF